MKKIIWIAWATLLLIGCDQLTSDLINSDVLGDRVFRVVASVEGENDDPETRVTLTPNGMGMSLAWEVGDTIQLLFRQTLGQETTRVKSTTTIKSISSNGKRGTFDIVVPTEISLDSPFDLYGVYGGGGLDDTNPNRALFTVNRGGTLDKVEEQKEVMLVFHKTNITDMSQPLQVIFRHIGHLFCLKLKNDGTETLNLNSVYLQSIVPNAESPSYKKWVISGTGNYYDLETQQYSSGTTLTDTLAFALPEGGIAPGDSCMLYAWCKAINSERVGQKNLDGYIIYRYVVPQLRLVIKRQSENNWYTLIKTPYKEGEPIVGRCFHFVASVTDTAVHFDFGDLTKPETMTDMTLTGDLCFAYASTGFENLYAVQTKKDYAGPNHIGVFYKRGESLYYNQLQDGTGWYLLTTTVLYPNNYAAAWSGEVLLGDGLSDVSAATDALQRLFVTYVTSDGKIGVKRRERNGTWSNELLIEPQNSGRCSKPEIGLNVASGSLSNFYVLYVDSKGNNSNNDEDFAEIMLAQVEVTSSYQLNLVSTEPLLTEHRTAQPEGGYIEERYPQGARLAVGDRYNGTSQRMEVWSFMTFREIITETSEGVRSSEYDIIIKNKYNYSHIIPVSNSDYIFDLSAQSSSLYTFAAAYTQNNVLQTLLYDDKPYPNIVIKYAEALNSVQLSNTSDNPASISVGLKREEQIYPEYLPPDQQFVITDLTGVDIAGNLINVSTHFYNPDPKYYPGQMATKNEQFIHNTSKQVKPGTLVTSVALANMHIYSLYTDLDGKIRVEYIDSANRDFWY